MKVDGTESVKVHMKVSGMSPTAGASMPDVANMPGKTRNPSQREIEKKLQEAEVRQAMEQVNAALNAFQRNVEYQMAFKDSKFVIQLVEKEGERVIYQMPPEGILQVAAKLKETLGMLVDKKV